VAKLDATGQNLLFSTYFGGGSPDGFSNGSVGGVAVDSSGLVWITGSASPQQLPVPQGTALLGSTYVAALSSDGTSVSYAMTAPSGAAGQAITTEAGGAVLALGTGNSVLVTTAGQGASLAGIANSAGSAVSNVVAPDEIISLYGVGIGPAQAATAQVVNGVLPNSLSGVRVLFDGTAAPLLYAGPTQINAIVPRAVANQNSTTIQVVTPSGTIAGLTLLQRPAAPNVFANFGVLPNDALSPFALALNQDGSINSLSNPAAAGSVVSVWATGTGLSTTAWPDGSIMNQNYGSAALPVSVLWFPPGQSGGDSLQVLYAGDAPGDVAGVSQVNFALPHAATNQTLFKLQVGTALSGSFSVYVQ
jgi:uncharacterized protein (TIGR03437 family)